MVLIGVVLIVLGVVAILGGVTATTSADGGTKFFGVHDVSPVSVFLIGLGSGVAILLGLAVIRFAARRGMERRRERKRLTQLSDQLDSVDRDRRHDDDEDRPTTI